MKLEEVEVRSIGKGYFEDLYNIDTPEQVAVHTCDFDGVRRGNYFGGESEGQVRVEKLKNGEDAGKDEDK